MLKYLDKVVKFVGASNQNFFFVFVSVVNSMWQYIKFLYRILNYDDIRSNLHSRVSYDPIVLKNVCQESDTIVELF